MTTSATLYRAWRHIALPALGAATLLACSGNASSPAAQSSASTLYESGVTFAEFLDDADRREDTWHGNFGAAEVPESLLERARAAGGSWRMLVVAEDWCGDSANTIPYVAHLADLLDNVEMRVVDSEVGRAVMEAHPTPDGRAATPTVVLMDEAGSEVGCFVERPAELQTWFLEQEDQLEEDDLYDQKYQWYDDDAGATTVREVVEMIEGAASGAYVCSGASTAASSEG